MVYKSLQILIAPCMPKHNINCEISDEKKPAGKHHFIKRFYMYPHLGHGFQSRYAYK